MLDIRVIKSYQFGYININLWTKAMFCKIAKYLHMIVIGYAVFMNLFNAKLVPAMLCNNINETKLPVLNNVTTRYDNCEVF